MTGDWYLGVAGVTDLNSKNHAGRVAAMSLDLPATLPNLSYLAYRERALD